MSIMPRIGHNIPILTNKKKQKNAAVKDKHRSKNMKLLTIIKAMERSKCNQ